METTAFAYSHAQKKSYNINKEMKQEDMSWWELPSVYMLYVKNSIDRWVLQYNHSSQKRFVQSLLSDVWSVLKFVLGVLVFFLFIGLSVKRLLRKKVKDPVLKLMQALLKRLAKEGKIKEPKQSMQNFLESLDDKKYHHIATLYNQAVYAQNKEKLLELKEALKV